MITADDYYLKVKDDRVIGTHDRHDADCFYIHTDDPVIEDTNSDVSSDDEADPLHDPYAGFYIYYKTVGGQQLFFTADSASGLILLATRTTAPANGKFFIEFPSSHTMAKLSDWPSAALHILRKTTFLRRSQCLVLRKEDPVVLNDSSRLQPPPRKVESLVLHAILGGRTVAAEVHCRCQFAIQNGGLSSGNVQT